MSRGWPALVCSLCGQTFRGSIVEFRRHQQTHRAQNRGIGFLSCLSCGFEADDAQEFSQHKCAQKELPGEDHMRQQMRRCQMDSRIWCASNISAADAKEYAQLDVNRAKKRHEKRRTNQVEVTTFELERMKTAATRNPAPRRKAAVAVQPKMMPCKRSPTRLGSQEKK